VRRPASLTATLVIVFSIVLSAPASADERVCRGAIGAETGGANVVGRVHDTGDLVRGSAEDQCARLTGGTASPAPGGTSTFSDTAGSVHEANIEKVAAAGIALGDDGPFRPNAPVTRGPMATFMQRAYRLPAGSTGFCDTRGTTHERNIDAVAAAGIVEGSGGCYRPYASTTRGHMASILARALGR
jgi:hypothetical protein